MEKKSIGEYISALRKVNGLTQKELAEKLNVTDKAVSRWENGDSLPDLSQIPVMAEIFGVSCDEILSGETRQTEIKSTESQNARAEKRIKKLLKDTKADFQNKTLISVGVIALGFLCVLLCNFAFLKAGLGFLLGCGFYIASVICQCCFSGGGKNKIDEEEMACEYKELSLFILNKNQKYTRVAICVFAFSLPCAFLLGNINAGLEFEMFLLASLASLIVALLVNITIVDSIFYKKSMKEELIDKNSVDARKTQAKLSVRKTVVVIFVIISVLTTGIYVMFMEMNRQIAIFTLLCVYAVISVGLLITGIAVEKKKVSQIS